MTTAPTSYEELREQLQSRLGSMAAGQQRIARLLLTDPEGTAFRSIGETARLAGVHQSSLVRFAAAFGLAGYPALVKLCRAQLAEQAQLVRRFDQATEHADPAGLLGAVAEHDQQNLARTFAMVDHADWERAVALLADSGQVHVIGLRKCFAVAYLMSYLLHLVRPKVRQLGVRPGLLVDDIRDLEPDDVVVAIAIHRYTADTVRALRWAKERGAHTIALTDNPSSPLAVDADLTFCVETSGVTVLRSMSAFVSIVQALATAVAVRRGTNTRAELLTDEKLLDSFDVYAD